MRTYTLRVRLSEEELKRVKFYAGHETLSSYARRMMVRDRIEVECVDERDKPELIGAVKPVEPDVKGERLREPLWKDAKNKRLL